MRVLNWGLIEYSLAVTQQLQLVEEVVHGAEEAVVFCRHPAVVTLGRATQPEEYEDWRGATVVTSRGGRATYHGPSQIVVYPILDLRRAHRQVPPRDLHGYLRALESALGRALSQIGIDSSVPTSKAGDLSVTGVWVGPRKIASIGIAVSRWVTYHGGAINVEADGQAFVGIKPCGFQRSDMTSVEEVLRDGHKFDSHSNSRICLQAALEREILQSFAPTAD